MYKNETYRVKINIDLEFGVYLFGNQSATGKTRLCKELKKLQAYDEPVASYTYTDKLLGQKIEDILIPNKFKVILLDRYDMYEGDGAEQIRECSTNSTILIDCKGRFDITNEDLPCYIQMTGNRIEVTEEDRAFCKNFKKYCKLVAKKDLHKCVSHSNNNNEQYNVYYTEDCKCNNTIEDGLTLSKL